MPTTIRPNPTSGPTPEHATDRRSADRASTATRTYHGATPTAGAADAFESTAGGTVFDATTGSASAATITDRFAHRFRELATDGEAFHRLLQRAFGDHYDRGRAEAFRQRALAGDVSWMPEVRFVGPESLGPGLGAYDAEGNVVYLSTALRGRPELAEQVLTEELGHFLDAQLNATDSPGDEGEMFRRLLAGEVLSAEQVAEIRAENDEGTVRIDGREIEVEFFFGKLFRSVGRFFARAGRAVGRFLGGVKDGVVGVVKNVWEGVRTFGSGFGRLFSGDFGGAFRQWGSGLLKIFVQTPVDATLTIGGKAISAVQTTLGIEPEGRKLEPDEIEKLRRIYGDSIDYDVVRIKEGPAGLFSLNDRPFVHGNTIYMKNRIVTDGLLVHEMAHVWQHQNGGTDYMSEALWSQSFGKGYDWQQSVPTAPWAELEPEQQAQFLEEAWNHGAFDPNSPNFGRFVYDPDGSNGPTPPVDYTAYLQAALVEIRAGRGAP